MKKIIDWCVKNRNQIFTTVLYISLMLIIIDDMIMKNPHTFLYYIVCIVLIVALIFCLLPDLWHDRTI
jgi:hypothetical protein